MGFQGQLSSVNLTDIFQTLNMNRQTGTLSVSGPVTTLHVYFDQGQVAMCTAPVVNGRPYLLDAMVHKGQLSAEKADELAAQQRASGQTIRDTVLASGAVADYELDEMCAWCIEELVCPIFEWQDGDFTFTDGEPVQEFTAAEMVAMGGTMVQTTQLVMEATRRMDEWKRIREVITDADAYYVVDNEGRANLKNVQTDPEMLKVLRYLDGRHTLDQIAMTVGVTRFDTFAIVAQLALAGVARPKTAQEVVDDAMTVMQAGDIEAAKGLLENALRQAPVPEVMRPLAECCVKLNQAPRAVELYLELIQMAQDQGDLQQALKDLDTVIALSPDDPDLHFERGQIQAELGQVEPAAASYSTAAQTYLSRKDLPRAIDACHRAKNLLPRAPEPHRYLARAYLLEGQTENAVVEYKSLWHALLTAERPKKALETLKTILEADCKYNNVKDQVLSHAQNSEAIKTSKAARYLVYVVIVLAIIGGGIAGWEYYQGTVVKRKGEDAVSEFEATVQRRMQSLEHGQLLIALQNLRSNYGNNPEVVRRLDEREKEIHQDLEKRAEALMNRAFTLEEAGKFDEAEAVVGDIKSKYADTSAASNADTLLESIRAAKVKAQVDERMKQAESLWAGLAWDDALQILNQTLERKDLGSLREDLTKKQIDWSEATRSAQRLYERAQKIEASGSMKEALDAYRRAAKGEGQQWIDKSRARVLAIELDVAREKGRLAQVAAQRGDDQQTFQLIDELAALDKDASSHEVSDYLASLELPFTLLIDNQHVQLVVKRQGQTDGEKVTAPAGKRGSWSHRVNYHLGEAVAVEASRLGFASQTFSVSIQARKTQGQITLTRGPRWRIDLSGVAATKPILANQLVLVSSDRGTVDLVDPVLGAARSVKFQNNIAGFEIPPFVFQDHAYAVLADQVFSLDLNSRGLPWCWPLDAAQIRDRLTGHLWVQEHEIKPGQLLVLVPTIKAGLLMLEVDPSGAAKVYPRLLADQDITGGPYVDHPTQDRSVLYVPAGNTLFAFDIASTTDVNAPAPLYTLNSRGDLIGKPVKARVADRDAMLLSDMTGAVIAVDCNPLVPQIKRQVGSWPVNGTVPSTPVCLTGQPVAYVSVVEGRVIALDLAHPPQSLWQFPAQGALGAVAGAPAIGLRGIYIADAKGLLHCLDPLTGSERWKAEIGGAAVGGILAQDGRIFVPTKSGQLVCFEEGED
jgi:tetratricopeptide (TPR) repeat protein